jgi:hypothetical protein
MDIPAHLASDPVNLVNRQSLSELSVGLELVAGCDPRARPNLHYWHREARSSNAEVDYVIQVDGRIVPIEVKAGTRGQLQSIRKFMDEREIPTGILVCADNFSRRDRLLVVPLYAVAAIRPLLERHNHL